MIFLSRVDQADQADAALCSGALMISGSVLIMSNGLNWVDVKQQT